MKNNFNYQLSYSLLSDKKEYIISSYDEIESLIDKFTILESMKIDVFSHIIGKGNYLYSFLVNREVFQNHQLRSYIKVDFTINSFKHINRGSNIFNFDSDETCDLESMADYFLKSKVYSSYDGKGAEIIHEKIKIEFLRFLNLAIKNKLSNYDFEELKEIVKRIGYEKIKEFIKVYPINLTHEE